MQPDARPDCNVCSIKPTQGNVGASAGLSVKLGDGNCQACTKASNAKPSTGINATWNGTLDELAAWSSIVLSLMKDCECKPHVATMYSQGTPAVTCEMHRAALEDQRWLDGLVFARRIWRMRMPNGRNRLGVEQ